MRYIFLENTGITEIHDSMLNIQGVELYNNPNLVNWNQIFANMTDAVKVIKLQNNPGLQTIAHVQFDRFNSLEILEIFFCENLQGVIPMSITEIPTLTKLRLVNNHFDILNSEAFFLQLAKLDKIPHGDFAMYQEGDEPDLQSMIPTAYNGLLHDKQQIFKGLFYNDLSKIWGPVLPANVEPWNLIAHHAKEAVDNLPYVL